MAEGVEIGYSKGQKVTEVDFVCPKIYSNHIIPRNVTSQNPTFNHNNLKYKLLPQEQD